MTHEVLHHALAVVLQAIPSPHSIGTPAAPPASHPNFGGCVDSPEAATDVLMAIGAAGLFYGSSLARKLSLRKRENA